jgi:hypothetical protein
LRTCPDFIVKRSSLIILAGLGVGITIAIFVTVGFGVFTKVSQIGGISPTYEPVDSDPYLTGIAKSATPVIDALEHYRHEHGAFPLRASDLAPYLPASSAMPMANSEEVLGWRYFPSSDAAAFTLARKLGWDPTLQFRFGGTNGQWVFSPGDGSPEIVLKLHP